MSKYKITAVISVSGVKTDDDAIKELEYALACWEDMRGGNGKNIDISVKTITEN